MNRKTRIGLVLIGLGIAALLLFFVIGPIIIGLFSGGRSQVVEDPTPGDIDPVVAETRGVRVVASEPIPPKSIITEDMLTTENVAESAQMEDFVASPELVAGYITKDIAINTGDPIRKSDLLGHVTKVGLAGLVRLGERAMVIPLNQPTLHDLIKIGDYVDVVATFEGQEANTIVSATRVLAVDLFGKDYPEPYSLAPRGSYRQGAPTTDVNAVPTPTPTADPNAPPGQAAPPPAAEEEDSEAPPPAAALTLEVTPQEATRIALAQAANARIDFILIPREEIPVVAGGIEVVDVDEVGGAVAAAMLDTVASTILPEVAPYSARLKRQGGNAGQGQATGNGTTRVATGTGTGSTGSTGMGTNRGGNGGGGGGTPTDWGPVDGGGIPPGPIPQGPIPDPQPQAPPPPETYQVKIIPNGKEARYETVLKP